jgi:hypothetical protein
VWSCFFPLSDSILFATNYTNLHERWRKKLVAKWNMNDLILEFAWARLFATNYTNLHERWRVKRAGGCDGRSPLLRLTVSLLARCGQCLDKGGVLLTLQAGLQFGDHHR